MTLVFIESNTTGSGMLAFGRASRLGVSPVLATTDPGRYAGLAETGVPVVVCDTNSPDSLSGKLREAVGHISGVVTTSEFYAVTVARVAAELALPGNAPWAVARCRDKGMLRETLVANGLPSPAFELIGQGDDADCRIASALSRIRLPCVVKPVDNTGSYDVLLCPTAAEVTAHCRRILAARTNVRGQATAATALVESYLDGPEYSVEMLSHGSGHRCVGVTAKRVTAPPYFVERGHVFPAPLPPEAVQTLSHTAADALSAVGITMGVTHVEMKLIEGHGYVVEINPRPAGGMIPEVVARSCGFDLLDAHLRAALGLEPAPLPEHRTPSGVAFLLAQRPGGGPLREVAGVPDVLAIPGVDAVTITAVPGSAIRAAHSSYDRFGYVLARADTHAELDDVLSRALGLLRPVFRGEPIGAP
jgi:cysteine synthase A